MRTRRVCEVAARCAQRTKRAQKYHPSSQPEYHPELDRAAKPLKLFGAGEGNRTLVISLEGCRKSEYFQQAVILF